MNKETYDYELDFINAYIKCRKAAGADNPTEFGRFLRNKYPGISFPGDKQFIRYENKELANLSKHTRMPDEVYISLLEVFYDMNLPKELIEEYKVTHSKFDVIKQVNPWRQPKQISTKDAYTSAWGGGKVKWYDPTTLYEALDKIPECILPYPEREKVIPKPDYLDFMQAKIAYDEKTALENIPCMASAYIADKIHFVSSYNIWSEENKKIGFGESYWQEKSRNWFNGEHAPDKSYHNFVVESLINSYLNYVLGQFDLDIIGKVCSIVRKVTDGISISFIDEKDSEQYRGYLESGDNQFFLVHNEKLKGAQDFNQFFWRILNLEKKSENSTEKTEVYAVKLGKDAQVFLNYCESIYVH